MKLDDVTKDSLVDEKPADAEPSAEVKTTAESNESKSTDERSSADPAVAADIVGLTKEATTVSSGLEPGTGDKR